LYNYTELRKEEYVSFSFDEDGSSHSIRNHKALHEHFTQYHKTSLPEDVEPSIVILPDDEHRLDYINNQFVKHNKKDLVTYLFEIFSEQQIKEKLTNWKVDSIESSPNWIFREFISLCIGDVLSSSYDIDSYDNYSGFKMTTKDIFLNFVEKIQMAMAYLNLKPTISTNEMAKNHVRFASHQTYHNSQLNITHWIDSVLCSRDNVKSPCKTIFDEAYAQFLLREKGYELRCYNLNTFPKDSNALKEILDAS